MEPRIVSAAMRNRFGDIICSPRHFDMTAHRQVEARSDSETWYDAEQGFITQHGIFLNRKEAYFIAKQNNQIIRRCGGDEGVLFSENLY